MTNHLAVIALLLLPTVGLCGQHFPQGEDSVTTYWPNGQVKEHYHVALHPEREEGDTTKLKIGLHQSWHDNGQLAEQCNYHFGECEGWFTSWYSNGQMKEKGYCFGERQGMWFQWYDNATIAEVTEYCAGRKSGRSVVWFQDDPTRVRWNLHYDTEGKLHGFCVWTGSADHEAWEGFYWEGEPLIALKVTGEYVHPFFEAGKIYNQELGLWVVWDETWQHVSAGKEVNGRRVGVWTHWMPNGDVFKEDYSKYCDK